MRNLTLENIASAVAGRLVIRGTAEGCEELKAREAFSVVIDSRKCEQDCIFVAVRGARVDGHSFIGTAFDAGALGVICEEIPGECMAEGCMDGSAGSTLAARADVAAGNAQTISADDGAGNTHGSRAAEAYIVVEDSLEALKKLAAYYRTQMSQVKIVGIVGSVGKTSTKELVAAVLSEHYSVLKTEGNFNNEIGVPLTILRIRDEHEMAVVEMGINHFGEMDILGGIVHPDAVVMTNIGPCHLEFLGDLDGVLCAKSEVFAHIADGGLLLLNGEDEKLNTVRQYGSLRIGRYQRTGMGEDVLSSASDIEGFGLEGTEFTLRLRELPTPGKTMSGTLETDSPACEIKRHARVNLPGPHMVMNSLAAAAIGREFGLSDDEIIQGIAAAKPVSGRSNLIRTEKYLIVDDCYNANPKSMKAAIDMMRDASGRKVAILGDMFELGEDAAALHGEVGRYAVEHGIDLLVCVGELSQNMYAAACDAVSAVSREEAKLMYFATLPELLEGLDSLELRSQDTILVKASHGMNFTLLPEALKS